MPTASLHLPSHTTSPSSSTNPLPSLLRLPSGLAILELQGDINFPVPESSSAPPTTVGNLIFPDLTSSDTKDPKELTRVWLYIGKHQRLTGEVKALAKPLGVIRKREGSGINGHDEELEIVDVVRYKIIFSKRPEPVGTTE